MTSCRNLDDLLRQVRTILPPPAPRPQDTLRAVKGIADTSTTSAAVAAAASRRRPPHTPRHAAPPKGRGGSGGGKSGDGGGKGGGGGSGGGPGGGGNPIRRSQEAFGRARDAKNGLPPLKKNDPKTTASDHVQTFSGWDPKARPSNFAPPNDAAVMAKCDEIGHRLTNGGCKDHGTFGRHYASHAEKQLALQAEEPVIGVSREVCKDCRGFFGKLAQHEGRDWYVTDPDGTWIFGADGTTTKP